MSRARWTCSTFEQRARDSGRRAPARGRQSWLDDLIVRIPDDWHLARCQPARRCRPKESHFERRVRRCKVSFGRHPASVACARRASFSLVKSRYRLDVVQVQPDEVLPVPICTHVHHGYFLRGDLFAHEARER